MRRFLNRLVSGFRSTNAARPARQAKPARARLSLETLDDRLTPTVISGTSGNDTIIVDVTASGGLSVSVNGQTSTISASQTSSVEIDPNGGANTVNILQTPVGIDVTVQCQGGTDQITLDGTNTHLPGSGNLFFVQSKVTINGDGTTSVSVDDTGFNTSPASYGLGAKQLFWGGVNGASLTYSNLANFTLNAGGIELQGVDSGVGIDSTAAGTVYRINTGQDPTNIGIGSGSLSDIQGPLAVFGHGRDEIDLFDISGGIKANYDITQNAVSRNGIALLTYGGIGTLTLDGTGAGDTYAIHSTAFDTSYVINAGNAGGLVKDTINLGEGSVDELAGAVAVNNEGGNVNVVLDDHGNAFPQTFTLGASSVSPTDFFGGLTYSGITSLSVDDGSGANTFDVTATPTTSVSLNGGSGSNKLIGPDTATAWTIYAPDRGTLGTNVGFSSIGNLVGGNASDTFAFGRRFFPVPTTGSITGSITGGGGTNALDYSALPGSVAVNLGTRAASQIRGGASGGFVNISRVVGNSADDTLTGPNAYTDWVISAADGGKAGGVAFTGFENLVGGSGVDSFRFLASGSLSGTLDGGLAPAHQGNWLDYSGLTGAVTVNLQIGQATGVAGGAAGAVSHIQDVHGGNGGNTLTGNSLGNILIGGTGNDVLIGGSGRSILIGDAGSDTVTGGSGGDILIGDGTTLDAMTTNNQRALMAILAEWQSADSYATRFTDIDTGTGGGLNGTAKLNFGATVLDDGSADTVTGLPSGQALDWFFQGVGDVLNNHQNGEHVNNT
jgi:hypothetical protein